MSITRRGLLAAVVLLASTAAAEAQAPPKPTAEHQKLGYYVGKWKGDGELKANPFMPAGKYTSSDECDWFQGGFAIVCRSESKGPAGEMKGLGIMGYNTEEKVYTYYGLDSSGMVSASVAKGTIEGDTWTYTDEAKFGGKLIKGRYTIKQLSPTSYTFKWEMQGDDGKWMALMEGTTTKDK